MQKGADNQKQEEQRAGIAELASSLRRAFDRFLSPTGQTTQDLAEELKCTQDAFEVMSAENVGLRQRIEDLTKRLLRPMLFSSAFARICPRPLVSLGFQPVRGLNEPEEVFGLPD